MVNKRRVLIIDDDKEYLDDLRGVLERAGYEVCCLNDSTTAVKTVMASRPDVVLLDLRMKRMSGFEVADEIHRLPDIKNIPIIAVTGHYTMKEHTWLMNFCGITKCLKKPFNPLDVIAEIEHVVADGK